MLRGNEKTIGLHKAAPRNLGSFTVADADGKKRHADGVPFFTWWTLGGYSGAARLFPRIEQALGGSSAFSPEALCLQNERFRGILRRQSRLRDTAVLHGCRRAAVSGAFAPAKENLVFEPLTSRLRTLRSPARYGFCPPEHSKNPCIFNRFRAFCKFGENTFGGIPYSAFTRSHPSPRSALHACNLPKDCDSTALRVFAIQSTIPSLQMR